MMVKAESPMEHCGMPWVQLVYVPPCHGYTCPKIWSQLEGQEYLVESSLLCPSELFVQTQVSLTSGWWIIPRERKSGYITFPCNSWTTWELSGPWDLSCLLKGTCENAMDTKKQQKMQAMVHFLLIALSEVVLNSRWSSWARGQSNRDTRQ